MYGITLSVMSGPLVRAVLVTLTGYRGRPLTSALPRTREEDLPGRYRPGKPLELCHSQTGRENPNYSASMQATAVPYLSAHAAMQCNPIPASSLSNPLTRRGFGRAIFLGNPHDQ